MASMVTSSPTQTFMAIWLHNDTFTADIQAKMKSNLNRMFYYAPIFTELQEFYDYICKNRQVAKIFLIISHTKQYLFLHQLVKSREEFERIYIFLSDSCSMTASSSCPKIITNIDKLFGTLSEDIQTYNTTIGVPNNAIQNLAVEDDRYARQILPPVGIFNTKCERSTPIQHLNEDPLSKEYLRFLCFLCMLKIILQMEHNRTDIDEMLAVCRDYYAKHDVQLYGIDKFKVEYSSCDAIKCYTANTFLFRMVSKAFRTECIKEVFKFRVYITDLNNQLRTLYDQKNYSLSDCVFRGKMLAGSVLQQLIDNEGGLVSINGFLSTTLANNVALMYAGEGQTLSGHWSVLFKFHVKERMKQPYANISHLSNMRDEVEILFPAGTIWRIESIAHQKEQYVVELTSCDQCDPQLTELYKRYTEDRCPLLSIGDFLRELGDYTEAEQFYYKTLKKIHHSDRICAELYYKIAMMRHAQKDHRTALDNLEKTAVLLKQSSTTSNEEYAPCPMHAHSDVPSLVTIFNNMGMMYHEEGEINEALEFYEKALEHNGSSFEIAATHNNIGILRFRQGNYCSAKEHYTKALVNIDKRSPWWNEFKRSFDRVEQHLQYIEMNQHREK